ncbi:MAG TPA: SDR family NAD(P)-dependent oxidoreductase [Steroidobacteraceae bacterium]|nr:SDR family NAD(P)-dependent oxidoreductase [Steroidobacteraceae bacterium]
MTAANQNRFATLNARFPRKRAFITGAGAGLGLELAKALAKDGWVLGLFDRNVERLAHVEAEFSNAGIPALAYPGDVTQSDELTVAVNSFAGTHDGLDLMINNAGVAVVGGLMEVPLEDWRWAIDINVMGVVHGSRAALPHLQRNGAGMIINIASAAAFASAPGMGPYNATKAAVLSFSETLAAELRPKGMQVSVVMPTYFTSGLLDTFRGPEWARQAASESMQTSKYTAADVARDALNCAARGDVYIALPKSARALWRMKRWMPNRFLRQIGKLHEAMRGAK